MSEKYKTFFDAERAAKEFELKTSIGGDFEVVAKGREQYGSKYEDGAVCYVTKDVYDLELDLTGNDSERMGSVKVKLPGLEFEIGLGWLSVENDYGWKNYTEFDFPKAWKKSVIEEES